MEKVIVHIMYCKFHKSVPPVPTQRPIQSLSHHHNHEVEECKCQELETLHPTERGGGARTGRGWNNAGASST